MDFFLWDYAKSLMYLSAMDDVETFRDRIVAAFQTMCATSGIWEYVQSSMRRRDEACIKTGGGHIEYFL